ncbi:MAG: hypothetical protein FWG82_06875 [Oscillospiraceae bacterium]|nr:hypothetical protein [Oscillospiraceae bacterium]
MEILQLSIFAENRPGRLAELTEKIASFNIDIRALSLADSADYGILRLIVDNTEKALDELKGAGLMITATKVLGVCVEDAPGGFSAVVAALAAAGISIEYAYAFLTPTQGKAGVVLRVKDNAAAIAVLQQAGIEILAL